MAGRLGWHGTLSPALQFLLAVGLACAAGNTPVGRSDAVAVKTIPRAEWASKPRDETRLKRHSGPIQEIVIHHSGASSHSTGDSKKRIDESIRSWHMEAHYLWGDVAYHYLIDTRGIIYEGRPEMFQGSSATKYDLDRRLLVCVLGDYRSVEEMRRDGMTEEAIRSQTAKYGEPELSPETRTALLALLSQRAKALGIPAAGIRTHRDLANSSCPGQRIQQWLENEGKPAVGDRLLLREKHLDEQPRGESTRRQSIRRFVMPMPGQGAGVSFPIC